jgi:transcriptional/translational regulatory protein YebC/TACO1
MFTGIEWIPLNKVDINKEKIEVIENFFEALEDDDDVQNFFTNINELNII